MAQAVSHETTIVSGVAGRYAQALFELAQEHKAEDKVAADLAAFSVMIGESADLQRFIKSPVFSADEQTKALAAILARANISGITANFLKLVAAKRRLFAISDMIADYRKLHDLQKGLSRADVTVAEPLKEEHVRALKAALADITSSKNIEIGIKVDPTILGGLIVRLGSRMVDGSLKTKLNSLRTRMKEVG
ncbi:MAG: F0F1 ATP synthase subunit delta [Methylovirgula sp.]